MMVIKGYFVFCFDWCGVGDSEGENWGFCLSGFDIVVVLVLFCVQCLQFICIVVFGNCDVVIVFVLYGMFINVWVFVNLWVVVLMDDMLLLVVICDCYV